MLYPSDANQAAQLVAAMADRPGVVYMRTTRGKTPVIYGPDETFAIGGSRVVRSSAADDVALVGAGVTLHEAMSAAETLAAGGITARVIDLYSIKPIDTATLAAATRETGRIVTVEDHRPEGGLGEAVLAALADADVHPRVADSPSRICPARRCRTNSLPTPGSTRPRSSSPPVSSSSADRPISLRGETRPFTAHSRRLPGLFMARR